MGVKKPTSADLVSLANELPNSKDVSEISHDEALGESLYRTTCLVAYGNGNGCFEDVAPFLSIKHHHDEEYDPLLEAEREEDCDVYKVVLPYAAPYVGYGWHCDERPLARDLKIPKEYRNSLNPTDKITWASRTICEDKKYQVFTFHFEITDDEKSRRWACLVAGQLIINAHIAPIYIGIYDGKPLFEPKTEADRLWLAFAELKKHQFPGICAVCGKAIDRKRESGGGKPQKTCNEHSNKLQNMKKQIRKDALEIGDTSMAYADIREMAARCQRTIKPELNERPLMPLGKEVLSYACMSMNDPETKESAGDCQ